MSRFQIAGVIWLIAAAAGAATTVIFRDEGTWYVVTLIASAVVAVVGILLMWKPGMTTSFLSTLLGIAWVAMYVALVIDQWDDFQAWTADAFLALVGAVAAFVGYGPRRQ